MNRILLVLGLVCWFIGGEILVVDKIVPHQYIVDALKAAAETDMVAPLGQGIVDLPESWGFVLVVLGTMFVMYSIAFRRKSRS